MRRLEKTRSTSGGKRQIVIYPELSLLFPALFCTNLGSWESSPISLDPACTNGAVCPAYSTRLSQVLQLTLINAYTTLEKSTT